MVCTWEVDRGQGTNNSSEGEPRSGPLFWLCYCRVSQPQTRSGRGLVCPQCTWVASWTNAPKSSVQSAKHITTLSLGTIVLVLWVLKAVVSDTTRIGKGNAQRTMVRPGWQNHPYQCSRSFTKSRKKGTLRKVVEGREKRSYHFLSARCYSYSISWIQAD